MRSRPGARRGLGARRGRAGTIGGVVALAACFVAAAARTKPVPPAAPASPTPPAPIVPDADSARLDDAELRRVLRMARPAALAPDLTNAFGDSPEAARFGQRLFFDARLSANGAVSCATCHLPSHGFTDGRPRGVGMAEGTRNTQGLLDIADLPWFTWDGRADSLWSQALHPFETPSEMGLTRFGLIDRIRAAPELRQEYEKIFGPVPNLTDPAAISDEERIAVNRAFSNLGKAIAAYERRLRTGPSPFDLEIERLRAGARAGAASGEPTPGFSDQARRGLKLFAGRGGCWRCHHGPSLSDGSFHAIGVPPADGGLPDDRGRLDAIARLKASEFNASGRYSDDPEGTRGQVTRALTAEPALWGAVRTPSLRNVARTAPYMHEGQFETLDRVVRFYSTLEGALADHHGEHVLDPLRLSDAQVADLVAFLRTLDGTPPDESLLRPLPPD